MTDALTRQPGRRRELQQLYQRLAEHDMAPLWERLSVLVAKSPVTPALPAIWDYEHVVRPYLMECGNLISAEEAERRVLILENPGLRGKGSVTHSLYAGVQLILPGEIAPLHRHTQCALRFVIEGNGAFTAVNGERTIMRPGDFVLTPSWRWHDHGNETAEPMVWLDGLDIPVVGFFDASFSETSHTQSQSMKRPTDDSRLQFGNNLFPVDWKLRDNNSPLINYPYERSRDSLYSMQKAAPPDASHGYKLRYVNPANGGSPMPTIGAYIQLLPAGFSGEPYRATDGTVYSVVEGEGKTIVGDKTLHWRPKDIFVVPSWYWHVHEARSDSVLFSFSDRPVHQALGFWRQEHSGSTWDSG